MAREVESPLACNVNDKIGFPTEVCALSLQVSVF